MKFIVLVVFLMGCQRLSPVEECEVLRDVLCDNYLDTCPGSLSSTHEQCREDTEEAGFGCTDVVIVNANYDDCIDAVEQSDECLAQVGLPEECDEVFIADE